MPWPTVVRARQNILQAIPSENQAILSENQRLPLLQPLLSYSPPQHAEANRKEQT
jgi:hypothetical protein